MLSKENYAAYEDFDNKIDLAGQLFANTLPEHKNKLLSSYYELKASGQCRPSNSDANSANGGLKRKFSKYFDLINSGKPISMEKSIIQTESRYTEYQMSEINFQIFSGVDGGTVAHVSSSFRPRKRNQKINFVEYSMYLDSVCNLWLVTNNLVLASGNEIAEAESMLDQIVSSKISKSDFESYQQHLKNEMGIENLFSDIDSQSGQRNSVKDFQWWKLYLIKWGRTVRLPDGQLVRIPRGTA